MSNILDIFRARAKKIINGELHRRGSLPGNVLPQMCEIFVGSHTYQKQCWESIRAVSVDSNDEMVKIADKAIEEHSRLITAFVRLRMELEDSHGNQEQVYEI